MAEEPTKSNHNVLRSSLKVSLAYAALGTLWIFLSDHALEAVFFTAPEVITEHQTIKGLAFIAVTAVSLYVLIHTLLKRQHQTEQTLAESEARLEHAVEAAQVGFWDWDLSNDSVYFSREWLGQIGYEPGDLPDTFETWFERLHPNDRDLVVEKARTAQKNPDKPFEAKFRLRHRDGSYRRILSQGRALVDETGTPVRMLGSHIDVTDSYAKDKQLFQAQKMEAVGQLIGGVAHDFNNLLLVISGNTELLRDRLEEAENRALLRSIDRACGRADGLIANLLSYARHKPLETRRVTLSEAMESTTDLLGRALEEQVELEIDMPEDLWQVDIDPAQFETAILNMAINARDAMPTGGRLVISGRNINIHDMVGHIANPDDPPDFVEISVTDTGEGMSERTVQQSMDPFFTTKDVGKGTGLGLSMVQGFVRQSGGHMRVYSEEGHGTTVKLYIPRAATPEEQDASTDNPPAQPVEGSGETILLVEDDILVREYMTRALEGLDYKVLQAGNGPEAMRTIRGDKHIDLLLTDVIMPGGMTGRELAEESRALRPELKVLYTSGYSANILDLKEGTDADAPLLRKPAPLSTLSMMVHEVLENKKAA